MLLARGLNRTVKYRPKHAQQTRGHCRGYYEVVERADEGVPHVIDTWYGRGVSTTTAIWGPTDSVAWIKGNTA
jgi:hypothetical protein